MSAPNKVWDAAVLFAMGGLADGKDWQEVQFDLLNTDDFASLFPSTSSDGGLVSDEDGETTMRIIREAEEELGYA